MTGHPRQTAVSGNRTQFHFFYIDSQQN